VSFEIVIGLEVHAELATNTKIFCGCTTRFGGEPNTQTCAVCSGQPGALPVFNKAVADHAITAGLALNCEINQHNRFDRKNYFYPDLPRAFQLSQLFLPICKNGHLDIETGKGTKRIGITQIHMEEDAGKLIHDQGAQCTYVDYNRGGTPLIEIVSAPDLRGADETIAYLEKLREILLYLGVCDCKMQEGSLRADVNLSVRPVGSAKFGVRVEMKNMNSLKAIHRAIAYESQRQIDLIEDGRSHELVQQTRRWDDEKGVSVGMRSKENAQDYRYFPEPDLLPLEVSPEWIERVRTAMPETAAAKRERYAGLGLTSADAAMLTTAKPLSDLFEQAAEFCKKPKETANMILGGVMRLMNDTATPADDLALDPGKLADLIVLIEDGTINRNAGKDALEALFKTGADPRAYIEEHGLAMTQDTGLIEECVDKALATNPQSIEDFKAGKEKAFGFLVGQAMKELRGKGDPQLINKLLKEKLG